MIGSQFENILTIPTSAPTTPLMRDKLDAVRKTRSATGTLSAVSLLFRRSKVRVIIVENEHTKSMPPKATEKMSVPETRLIKPIRPASWVMTKMIVRLERGARSL